MKMHATAQAHPNIAFIKFWGLADEAQRIPTNGSISMNINSLRTKTTVEFDTALKQDALVLDGQFVTGEGLARVGQFLNRVRKLAAEPIFARVISENSFSAGAGLASSASGFAALTLAATAALSLQLTERQLSSLARFGSGSASRSIPAGFVEWVAQPQPGETYATSIAPPEHWALVDCIAIIDKSHKAVGSELGMRAAATSPFQKARVDDANRRLNLCRSAVHECNFDRLSAVTELDSNMMHAVMMTSNPPLYYWQPTSFAVMSAVKGWQKEGLPVTFTLDAGPNVHVITPKPYANEVIEHLSRIEGVLEVLSGGPGGPANLVA